MKSPRLLALAWLCAVACQAAPPPVAPPPAAPVPATPAVAADTQNVNYSVRVEWRDTKKGTNSLQLVTCDGNFNLNTISGTVTLGDADIPITVKLQGALTVLDADQGRLQIFLGRTVPYPTSFSTGPGAKGNGSYSQMSVGLDSRFIVTFGKPLVIQSDDNGEVAILIKRLDK